MPTRMINTLAASGGDYSLISTWNADLGSVNPALSTVLVFSHGGINGSLGPGANVTGVTSGATGQVVVISATQVLIRDISGTFQSGETVDEDGTPANNVVLSDAGDGAVPTLECTNPFSFDDAAILSGVIGGDTDNFIEVRAAGAALHGGDKNAGCRLSTNNAPAFDVNGQFRVITGLVVNATGGSGLRLDGQNQEIQSCIITNSPTNGIRAGAANQRVKACWIDQCSTGLNQVSASVGQHRNNTITQCTTNGMDGAGANTAVNNTVCYDSTTTDFAGTYFSNSQDNAASDTTAPGFFPENNLPASAFQDEPNDDFRPADLPDTGPRLNDEGVNMYSATPLFASQVRYDILGNEFPSAGAWPIGAWQVPSAGAIDFTTHPTRHITRDNTGALGESEAGFTIDGTHTGATSVEYRVFDIDAGTFVTGFDWQVGDASPGASDWSISVPAGIPAGSPLAGYRVDVRQGNDTGITASSNAFGIGPVGFLFGSSNTLMAGDDGTPTSAAFGSQWNIRGATPLDEWKAPVGQGSSSLIDTLAPLVGCPVGLVYNGQGNVPLDQRNDVDGTDFWLDQTGGSIYDDMITAAVAIAGLSRRAEFFCYHAAEFDANNGPVSAQEIRDSLIALYTNINNDFNPRPGTTNMPFFVVETGRETAATASDQGYSSVREGIADAVIANANIHHGDITYAYDLQDTIHFTNAAYATIASNIAHAVADVAGESGTNYSIPRFLSFAAVNDTTTDVTLTGQATLFVNAGGDMWQAFDGNTGTWVQCTASVENAGNVRLTHPSIVGNASDVRYGRGANPTIAGGTVGSTDGPKTWYMVSYPGLASSLPLVEGAVDSNPPTQLRRQASPAALEDGDQRRQTISFWIRPQNVGGFEYLLICQEEGQTHPAGSLEINVDTSGRARLLWHEPGSPATIAVRLRSTVNMVNDTWYHHHFAWDTVAGVGFVYTDGVDATEAGQTIVNNVDPNTTFQNMRLFRFGAIDLDTSLRGFWWDDSFQDPRDGPTLAKFFTTADDFTLLGADGSTPTGTPPMFYMDGLAAAWLPGNSLGGPNRGRAGGWELETGSLQDFVFAGTTTWDLQTLEHQTFDWEFIGNTDWDLVAFDHETFDWAFIGNTDWALQGFDHETFDWDHTQAGTTTWDLQSLNHETFDWQHVAPGVTTWDLQTFNHETFDWQHVTPGTTTWDLQTFNHETFEWGFAGHFDWTLEGFDHETLDFEHVVPAVTSWDLQTLNHTTFDWVAGTLIRSELCVQIRVIPAIISCTSEMRGFETVCSDKVHALKADSSNLIQWEAKRGDTGAAITDGSGTFQLFDATDTEVLPGSILVINAGAGLYQAVIDTSTLVKGRRYRGRAPLTFPSVAQTRTYKFWFEITDDADNECILQECA